MVEWLEGLSYGAKSHWKVVSSNLSFTILGLENSLSLSACTCFQATRIKQ